MDAILARAKAIAALIGAAATAALGILPAEDYKWLAVLAAVATAISVYAVPNKTEDAPVEVPDNPAVPTLDPEVMGDIDPAVVYEEDETPPAAGYEPRH